MMHEKIMLVIVLGSFYNQQFLKLIRIFREYTIKCATYATFPVANFIGSLALLKYVFSYVIYRLCNLQHWKRNFAEFF